MPVSTSARVFVSLLRDAFREFHQNQPLRMAAATAFFTTFALPPILIILIQVFGLFTEPRTISHHLFEQLRNVLGNNTVSQIRETLRNVRHLRLSWYIAAAGFLFLVFIATTLFTVIKDSLNQIWKIQLKEKPGIAFILGYRVKSVAIIIVAGLLFLTVLLAEAIGALLKEYTYELGPAIRLFLTSFINQLVSAAVVMTWFTLVFKFLADGRPNWKTAMAGGIFTGLLFTAGKLLLRWLLSHSNMQTIYGASASFVLLLLFVFYSSFIFYYGACFTKVWADYKKQPILPTRHAVRYILQRIEMKESRKAED
jgi:membrane protein